MKKLDVVAAKKLGYSDAEIRDFMAQNNLVPKANVVDQAKRTVKGAGKFVGNVLSAPVNLYKMGEGLSSGDVTLGDIGSGLVKTYKDRYGGWDEIMRSAYFDPVDVASDISLVSGLVGSGASALGATNTANKLQKVSQATNPMNAMISGGKVLTKPVTNLFSKKDMPGFLDDASSALAKKSLRPSPSQQTSFKEATDMDIGDYMRDMGVQGGGSQALKKIEPIVNSLQKKYNALARSGKGIDFTDYIDDLRKTANEITKSKDFGLEASDVANNLLKRADVMETRALEYMIANNTNIIPIDILTSTKSSAFGKVPKGTMADPTRMHGGKLTGGVGVGELEKLAPGTQKLGKSLEAGRAFQDMANQQAGIGKGTQLINAFKPSGYGSIMGAVLGGVPGAALGGVVSMAANSPQFLSGASRALHTGANLMRGANVSPTLSKVASQVPNIAKYSQPLSAIQKSATEQSRKGLQQPQGIPMERSKVRGLKQPELQPYKQFNTEDERKKKNNYPSYY